MAMRREAATERQSVPDMLSPKDSLPFGSQNRTSEAERNRPQVTGY